MEYEKGFYPVAKATSLTLERLTQRGLHAELQPMQLQELDAIKTSTHFLMNIRTLYRSIHSAYSDPFGEPTPEALAKALADEIDTLMILFHQTLELDLEPVFYHFSYESLPYFLPYARMRKLTTDLQHKRHATEMATYKALPEHTLKLIERSDCELKGTWGNCLMLTHLPVDLLSRRHCTELWLVETNTGRVKGREEWSQKLVSKKDQAAFLPFNKMTLTVFGDGNKLLTGFAPSSKKVTLEAAVKHNWNPIVGDERVYDTLDRERDVPFFDMLKKALRS